MDDRKRTRMKFGRLYWKSRSWIEDNWTFAFMVLALITALVFASGLLARQPQFIVWGQTPVSEMKIQDVLTLMIVARLVFYDWSHKK